jgi:hypothetical protein
VQDAILATLNNEPQNRNTTASDETF